MLAQAQPGDRGGEGQQQDAGLAQQDRRQSEQTVVPADETRGTTPPIGSVVPTKGGQRAQKEAADKAAADRDAKEREQRNAADRDAKAKQQTAPQTTPTDSPPAATPATPEPAPATPKP